MKSAITYVLCSGSGSSCGVVILIPNLLSNVSQNLNRYVKQEFKLFRIHWLHASYRPMTNSLVKPRSETD